MREQSLRTGKWWAAAGALMGWLAVGAQLYLILQNRTASVPETIVRFFSFFTVLTNILVAICFTALCLRREKANHSFFTRPAVLAAVTVYITVVGLVYNIILRRLWQPQGLQRWVDEWLHSVMPLWFVAYWLLFVPKSGLTWRNAFTWLLYPLVYCVYILVRGAASGFYPYPFVNAAELGYAKVGVNCLLLCATFLVLSLLLIAVANRGKKV